jgi:hypothetical protein
MPAEVAYLHDYWHPITLLPWPTLEDMFYGFGVTGAAVAITPAIMRWRVVPAVSRVTRRNATTANVHDGHHPVRAPGWIVPSIWMAVIAFIGVGAVIVVMVPEMLAVGLITGALMAAVSAAAYAPALDVVIDGRSYLSQVYLLYGTPAGHLVFGNVPLDEVVGNGACGWAVGILVIYASNRAYWRRCGLEIV